MSWRAFLDALFQRPIGTSSATLSFSIDPPPPVPQTPPPVPRRAAAAPRDPRPTLKDALRLASMVVADTSRSVPILSHVRLSEGQLMATDLEQFLVVELPELHLAHPVCAPLRMLRDLAPQLTGPLTMTIKGTTLIINDRWRLPTLDATEFPVNRAQARLDQDELRWMGEVFPVPAEITALFPAMSTDESRQSMCGIFFDRNNGRLAASNGHVLYLLEGLEEGEENFLVPAAALTVVRMMQQRAPVEVGYLANYYGLSDDDDPDDTPEEVRESYACFSASGVRLWTRLTEERFPDYEQVLPNEKTIAHRFTLPRAPLIEALHGVVPLLPRKKESEHWNKNLGALLYSIRPGEGVLLYTSPDTGEYRVTFPAPGWPLGFYVGLGIKYLLDVLKWMPGNPETVEVAVTSDISPTRWSSSDFTAIVMPMRALSELPTDLVTVIEAQKRAWREAEEHDDPGL